MVEFPKTIQYTDDNKPDWLVVIKDNPENPFTLTLTWQSYDTIRLDEENIEGLLMDLQQALTSTGLTVSDVYAIMNFIRFATTKITLVVNGTGTDNYEIILPAGLTVIDVRTAAGESIPFFFNYARNSVVFTVTFHSVETIELITGSITNILNRTIQTIVTVMLTFSILTQVINQLREALQEVR